MQIPDNTEGTIMDNNTNLAPITYREYLSLPETRRATLPAPFLTVRWWDHDEVSELPTQSWFGKLRTEERRVGKECAD